MRPLPWVSSSPNSRVVSFTGFYTQWLGAGASEAESLLGYVPGVDMSLWLWDAWLP